MTGFLIADQFDAVLHFYIVGVAALRPLVKKGVITQPAVLPLEGESDSFSALVRNCSGDDNSGSGS